MNTIPEFPAVPSHRAAPSSLSVPSAMGPPGILSDWLYRLAEASTNGKIYRLAWLSDDGYVTSERGYLSADAARRAVPVLNLARTIRGRHPYTHLAEFIDGRCVNVTELEVTCAT